MPSIYGKYKHSKKLNFKVMYNSLSAAYEYASSVTDRTINKAKSGISYTAKAIIEMPHYVVQYTLLGMTSAVFGGAVGFAKKFFEHNDALQEKLKELAAENPGCSYQLPSAPHQRIHCLDNPALAATLIKLAGESVFAIGLLRLPYTLTGINYGLTLGGFAGCLFGAYQAAKNKTKHLLEKTSASLNRYAMFHIANRILPPLQNISLIAGTSFLLNSFQVDKNLIFLALVIEHQILTLRNMNRATHIPYPESGNLSVYNLLTGMGAAITSAGLYDLDDSFKANAGVFLMLYGFLCLAAQKGNDLFAVEHNLLLDEEKPRLVRR